jgi:hypothetical protein
MLKHWNSRCILQSTCVMKTTLNWSNAFILWIKWLNCHKTYNLHCKNWTQSPSQMSSSNNKKLTMWTNLTKFRRR